MALINETARALGVTAIPGPGTDSLYDGWFVHQFVMQKLIRASGVGFTEGQVYEIDSKAMRKFEGDEGLVFMVENNSPTDGFDIIVGLRILIKAG